MSTRELRSSGGSGGTVIEYVREPRRRKRVLDVDLNVTPPDGDYRDVAGVVIGSREGQTSGHATIDLEEIDDEVVISSPRSFAEAARNKSRRPRRALVVDHEEIQVHQAGEALITLTLMSGGVPLNEGSSDWNPHINIEDNVEGKNFTSFSKPFRSEPEPQKEPTFNCPICMGPLEEEMSTKCGHIFCKACIKAAIAAQGKCPTCRKKLTVKDIFRIYLPKTS
ncbi:hypothetical protein GIB67_034910 [Kingdonia uniflora]|uniref:RING-type domain-containing protein n=1 Tax=Kingdonia uniflora TaxID=39325 RepID=A0A7J7NGJ9_9MAGN|nr:hypothetical protein GIB67_034910 [Kingdonia uniflora]